VNSDAQTQSPQALSQTLRRRAILLSILRSVGVAVVGFSLYFTLPFDSASHFNSGAALTIGLVAMTAVTGWQTWAITHSPIPRVRAMEGLLTTFPLFVLLFATTYFLMGQYRTSDFSQPLTRIDSLYFTVTTFATVGYGDIVPVSQAARLTVTVQMVVDLVLIGLVVRTFVNSVRTGLARRDSPTSG
jgi:Ion channel